MPSVHARKRCTLNYPLQPIFLITFHTRYARFVRGMSRNPLHDGVDISAPKGTPISVAAYTDGGLKELRVCATPLLTGYGYAAAFEYYMFALFIAHLDRLPEVNDSVVYVGATGRATGYHAHIECLLRDDVVNPLYYCKFRRKY